MLMGLVAPRGPLVLDNTSFAWLGGEACYSCGVAEQRLFEALGVANAMGYSHVGHAEHCLLPAEQQPEVTEYIRKYLLNGTDTAQVK